ncbi:MAG: uroporphyrinogen-III synthase [Oligoflexales bacterium]
MGIIWTRPAGLWAEDKSLLKGTKHLRLPCLAYHDFGHKEIISQLPESGLPESGSLIGVLSSAHTVMSLNNAPELLNKCKKWYAVGERTRDCFNASKNSRCYAYLPQGVRKGADLASFLCKFYQGQKITFFLPGAKKRAYQLDTHLLACGFQVVCCNTYEVKIGIFNTDGGQMSKKSLEGAVSGMPDPAVCFASPSAVAGFTSTLEQAGLNTFLQKCKAVAIGPTTLKACQRSFQKVFEASDPSMVSLVELAKNL